jgi:hypothetical protein
MKNKSNPKSHPKQHAPNPKSNRTWWMLGVVVLAAAVGVIFWKDRDVNQNISKSTSTPPSQAQTKTDEGLLVGRWTRTDSDGAYVIEIKHAGDDGTLEASYFNPSPIKVGRAGWEKKNNILVVVVELRDVNYPGSTYTLNFIPSENRMTGIYYQAVEGANFDVEFVRVR